MEDWLNDMRTSIGKPTPTKPGKSKKQKSSTPAKKHATKKVCTPPKEGSATSQKKPGKPVDIQEKTLPKDFFLSSHSARTHGACSCESQNTQHWGVLLVCTLKKNIIMHSILKNYLQKYQIPFPGTKKTNTLVFGCYNIYTATNAKKWRVQKQGDRLTE